MTEIMKALKVSTKIRKSERHMPKYVFLYQLKAIKDEIVKEKKALKKGALSWRKKDFRPSAQRSWEEVKEQAGEDEMETMAKWLVVFKKDELACTNKYIQLYKTIIYN